MYKHKTKIIIDANDKSVIISKAWIKYNALSCFKKIALNDVQQSTLNACWKSLCPQVDSPSVSVRQHKKE